MFPDLMELRQYKTKPPQLLLLGADFANGKVVAHGYITKEPLRKGRKFYWEGWRFKLNEGLEGEVARLYPLHLEAPLELEIDQWPTKTMS